MNSGRPIFSAGSPWSFGLKNSPGAEKDLPRQIKRVFENMGLCWIDDDQPVRVTPAGHAYLNEPAGRKYYS